LDVPRELYLITVGMDKNKKMIQEEKIEEKIY